MDAAFFLDVVEGLLDHLHVLLVLLYHLQFFFVGGDYLLESVLEERLGVDGLRLVVLFELESLAIPLIIHVFLL